MRLGTCGGGPSIHRCRGCIQAITEEVMVGAESSISAALKRKRLGMIVMTVCMSSRRLWP